jgi:hypothetical protein
MRTMMAMLVANVFWKLVGGLLAAVIQTSEAAELTLSQGFLFTGPKQLQSGTTERFCVSIKDASHSVATCKLDLIVENSTIASVDHQLNGIFNNIKVK